MTSQRLVTKCPLTYNHGSHHCHYGLGPLYAHMKQVHTGFILITIMQDMNFNYCHFKIHANITNSFGLFQISNYQAHNQEH